MSTNYDPMSFGGVKPPYPAKEPPPPPAPPATSTVTVGNGEEVADALLHELRRRGVMLKPDLSPTLQPMQDGEPQNIYPSGYMRSKAPSWHLLYRPFLAAMVKNMTRGEKNDGPGNPPNYLKATPNEDKYSFDHGEEHMHKAIMALQAGDIETAKTNLVSWACNAMLIYHTICEREKSECKSK